MENNATDSIHPIVLLLASLAYCHFLLPKLPKGLSRLIILVPVLYIFSILPWYFSSSFLRGLLSFFITWIASFKLLLLCFNNGPLISTKESYIDFIAISIFPLNIKEHIPPPNSPSTKGFRKLLGIIIPLFFTIFVHQEYLPPQLALPFNVLSIISASYMVHKKGVTNYELVPIFNKPYLATSLTDFWGRRWNQYSSSILRQTVYQPVRGTLSGIVGTGSAKLVAVIATLVVSGVMHELMFYYITCGMRPTYEVTTFFVFHGLCMVLEAALRYIAMKKRWNLVHPATSIILTVGFVTITFYWLLVLPVWKNAQTGYCSKLTYNR